MLNRTGKSMSELKIWLTCLNSGSIFMGVEYRLTKMCYYLTEM